MKSVFIIAIVAVTMIGVMVPSVFAELYVSEINDYVILIDDSWVVEEDVENQTMFVQGDSLPIIAYTILHDDVDYDSLGSSSGVPATSYSDSAIPRTGYETAMFRIITNMLYSYPFPSDYDQKFADTVVIDGKTAYQVAATSIVDGTPCSQVMTVLPTDSSWVLHGMACGGNPSEKIRDFQLYSKSFKFEELAKEKLSEQQFNGSPWFRLSEEINDTKTALDNGKIIYIKEYSDINEFKDIRLLEHPDYDLLQINYVYQHYEANDRYGTPFGSMKATSEFSLDYDSWPSYNYLATDEGTWMGTTMPGSDVVGAECPSYFSKSLNPNIPYTIIACYEIPKNVNYFYFEDILFSKSTIASSDYLKSTITQLSPESEEGGGCLIATATYGSEMAPQVQQLRELRDNQLLNTESGTSFMVMFNDIYYSFSPTIADYERENPLFKEAIKLAITPMISTLSLMENANSESEVLGLGLSVIALNLGMYLGVPAIVIVGIRKKF